MKRILTMSAGVLCLVGSAGIQAVANDSCKNNSYENFQPPTNPERYEYYYYGFAVTGICSANDAQDAEEKKIALEHPEGYYKIEMRSTIQTRSRRVYNTSFVVRSFEAKDGRDKVEKIASQAVSWDPVTNVPQGLPRVVQNNFVDILPLLSQVFQLREDGQGQQADALRAEAAQQWLAVLAAAAQ